MNELLKPQKALISVFHKDGLDELVSALDAFDVKFLSTGGTEAHIRKLGKNVEAVEDITGYPSILGGRVKTLHPAVFGGILARRGHEGDHADMAEHKLSPIDIVIVDLYPFTETVASGGKESEIIEKIDIGGISLIRAAAKNFADVWIISNRNQYARAVEILRKNNGSIDLATRKQFAMEAFAISSEYDTAIQQWFANAGERKTLRYGENPHQKGYFKGKLDEVLQQHHGKELSYNNLLDIDATLNLLNEFSEPTFIVVKHNNACGLASRASLIEAWKDALAGDPVSAFGGVIACNRTLDAATATEIDKLFCEVVMAPDYDPEALEILKQKKNRIVLSIRELKFVAWQERSILNGTLVQERNSITDTRENLEMVTKTKPTDEQIEDLLFASKISKHTKSNTIVLAKNKQLIGSGTGQTSRVDALRQSLDKAVNFGFETEGAVMASDAFFPFPDCVEIADKQGIKAVIQPGGSIKDNLSISYCDDHDMAMVFTGTRHFKH
ncbi:MAG: bifunctional phosphoribosylaminoimidazolecarboxamide formyltransferase/IMP cyclohydrolase [Cryomorphaceae bacterium]|nr:bifunctional phosphoribosylaminoimidazolecarboxamide formyltransferase/IMP cyclohydrolase [Cryomorphaceae bacterium]